jgi:hypothetical protein
MNFKIILLMIVLLFCYAETKSFAQQKTITITGLGYVPGSRRNVVPIIKEALKQCESGDTIVFPRGRYDFWQDLTTTTNNHSRTDDLSIFEVGIYPEIFTSRFSTGLPLENLKNVVIDGDSSEFIFHGAMQIANIEGSENIVLKNFSADWDFPYMFEGRYLDATDNYIELEFDINQYRYVIENERFFLTGEGWKDEPTGYCVLFDRDTKEILYKTNGGNNSHLFNSKAVEIMPGVVRFYGKPNTKPPKGTYTNLMASRHIAMGITINNSKDVYLKDITIYHALGIGVTGSRTENITMDNTNMKINEKKGRVTSILADASHFSGCKGLIKVINCAHTGTMDDFINVHGAYTKIDSITGNNSVIAKRAVGEPGEEIWFVNPVQCQRSEVCVIQSVEYSDSGSKTAFVSPLPKEVKTGDYMENKTWTAALELRNCSILRQHRAVGIRLSTPKKVVIEDNYFSTARAAILMEGDMSNWFESGANMDVTIRNNVFDNCLTSGCHIGRNVGKFWEKAIITITPSHQPQNDQSEPYHQNIRIENNTFKTFDVPLVHAVSVRGFIFRNNEIIRTYAFEPYLLQKTSFFFNGCRDVIISGNKIHNEYVTRTIEAQHMKRSDIKFEDFSLILK